MKITKRQIKQERFQYMLNTVLNECEKKSWNKIGFTSSSLEECYVDDIVRNLREKAKEKELKLQVEEIKPVNYFADGVEQARTCDSVVFVERYAYTYYKDLQNSIKLLEKEDIPILGVVTYR